MQLTISKTNRGVALPVGGVVGTIRASSSGLVLDVSMAELEYVRARSVSLAAAGSLTEAVSALPKGSYTPNTAPDGASSRLLMYFPEP